VAFLGANRHSFFEEYGVWKDAPVLMGTTRFEPLPDVKNIMITGGSGFMYDQNPRYQASHGARNCC